MKFTDSLLKIVIGIAIVSFSEFLCSIEYRGYHNFINIGFSMNINQATRV